jgi:hypothetical protein
MLALVASIYALSCVEGLKGVDAWHPMSGLPDIGN